MRYKIKVTFYQGDKVTMLLTDISADSPDSVCDYYLGRNFNFGIEADSVWVAKEVAFYDGEYYLKHKRSLV